MLMFNRENVIMKKMETRLRGKQGSTCLDYLEVEGQNTAKIYKTICLPLARKC